MNLKKLNIELREHELSAKQLNRLKWCTTIAIIGFPIMVQILGAAIYWSGPHPVLTSMPALGLYSLGFLTVLTAGIYAVSNRVFLRFSGANRGLAEWESRTQSDAFAFSYKIIAKAVLLAFMAISVLGLVQLLQNLGYINSNAGQSIVLRSEGLAAITVILTYLVLLLPTLYIAWTLSPLDAEE